MRVYHRISWIEETKMGKPQTGDLILFQIESGIWTAVIYPILAQKLYANKYEDIKQKALKYTASYKNRDISVWKEIDANTKEYLLEK